MTTFFPILIALTLCNIFGKDVSAFELSCTDVIRTRVNCTEDMDQLSFNWQPNNESCFLRWKIMQATRLNPIGLTCYAKLPQDNGECSNFLNFEISDGDKGRYIACGDTNFSFTPTENRFGKLYLSIETKLGYPEGGYIHCFVKCIEENEFLPLPEPVKTEKKIPTFTDALYNDSFVVNFSWPLVGSRQPENFTTGYWNVFSEGNCTVGVQCTVNVDGDCNETGAYVKVSDGSKGEQTFCGNLSFYAAPSETQLRDMFVKVNAPNDPNVIQVKCFAQCGHTGVYQPVSTPLEAKTDMKCVCGLNNNEDRIIGGENATLNEFPWQVAIVKKNSRTPFCGGTVINDRFVLTARHCIEKYTMSEHAEILIHANAMQHHFPPGIEDRWDLWHFARHPSVSQADEDEKTQRIKIAGVVVADPWTTLNSLDFDFGLIRLEKKIDFGQANAPTPVCLPSADQRDQFMDQLLGKILTTSGWGDTETGQKSEVLKKANVPYVPKDQCISDLRRRMQRNTSLITQRMMCAYVPNEDEVNDGICSGDSGGPLNFQNDHKQWVQVGINSFVVPACPIKWNPAVYAKTSEIMQWIHFHSNEWGAKWCQDYSSA